MAAPNSDTDPSRPASPTNPTPASHPAITQVSNVSLESMQHTGHVLLLHSCDLPHELSLQVLQAEAVHRHDAPNLVAAKSKANGTRHHVLAQLRTYDS
jgi:hypothetical protein